MISTNLSETGPPRIPPTFYKGPPSPDDKTDRVAAMNKITNFSIAAIMNSRGRKSEDDADDFEAKRRKLAEAVPALGKTKNRSTLDYVLIRFVYSEIIQFCSQ